MPLYRTTAWAKAHFKLSLLSTQFIFSEQGTANLEVEKVCGRSVAKPAAEKNRRATSRNRIESAEPGYLKRSVCGTRLQCCWGVKKSLASWARRRSPRVGGKVCPFDSLWAGTPRPTDPLSPRGEGSVALFDVHRFDCAYAPHCNKAAPSHTHLVQSSSST